MIGLGILIFFIIMALCSPLLPLYDGMYDPVFGYDPDIHGISPPSPKHPLGTVYMGRDMLSQLMHGARIALLVGLLAAFTSIVLGTIVGLVSGYYRGVIDSVLMRFVDLLIVLPALPLLLIISAAFGEINVFLIAIIIGVISWGMTARVIRSQVLSLRERPFVKSAKVSGASDGRIIFKHIMPNILPLTFLYMTMSAMGAILYEATLAFLGFGDTSKISWGVMINQWRAQCGGTFGAMWWMIPPGACITILVFSIYIIGRACDEIVNPRLRER
jgi:peptide/nickel transport system permease protein